MTHDQWWEKKELPKFRRNEVCESTILAFRCISERTWDTALAESGTRELYEALTEIAKGEGRFSCDPKTHAENTIEDMKALAVAAIAKYEGQKVGATP